MGRKASKKKTFSCEISFTKIEGRVSKEQSAESRWEEIIDICAEMIADKSKKCL